MCLIPKCDRTDVSARGLCSRCYTAARHAVKRGEASWQQLEEHGLCLSATSVSSQGVFRQALGAANNNQSQSQPNNRHAMKPAYLQLTGVIPLIGKKKPRRDMKIEMYDNSTATLDLAPGYEIRLIVQGQEKAIEILGAAGTTAISLEISRSN